VVGVIGSGSSPAAKSRTPFQAKNGEIHEYVYCNRTSELERGNAFLAEAAEQK
jgi:hypothetical protein